MEIDFNTENNLDLGFTSSVSMDENFDVGQVPSGIDQVKVDGTPLPVINKSVNIDLATPLSKKANINQLPHKTSQLTNDGSDGTSTYVEANELGAVATSNDYNDLNNKPTIPAPITVDSKIDNTSTNPVQNQALYNAIVGTEVSKMAYTSGWVEPYAPDGYNTYIILTLPSGTFTDNSLIELVNYTNFQSFAKHGFIIFGVEVSTQRVWISSMGVPESNISFNFRMYNYGS